MTPLCPLLCACVPVFVLSRPRSGSVEQYKRSGFNGILGKPFTVAHIRAVVQYCLTLKLNPSAAPTDEEHWFSNLE